MILAFIKWNVNPEIFEIGPLSIRWYGLLFALAFVAGYIIFVKYLRDNKLSDDLTDKLLFYMAVGTVVGARLGHVFFYDAAYYLKNPFEILKIWHGGLASHGASVGILLAVYLFTRKYKYNYMWLLDRIVIVVASAGFFIRLGNLMNSEIYGIQTALPWGFVFIREGELVPKHPTQLYEALVCLCIFFAMMYFKHKTKMANHPGKIFGFFLVALFTSRFFIEFIKNPQSGFEQSMILNMGQILSIPFALAGVYYLFRKVEPFDSI